MSQVALPLSEMKLTLELLATLGGSVQRRRVIKGVTKRLFRTRLDLGITSPLSRWPARVGETRRPLAPAPVIGASFWSRVRASHCRPFHAIALPVTEEGSPDAFLSFLSRFS